MPAEIELNKINLWAIKHLWMNPIIIAIVACLLAIPLVSAAGDFTTATYSILILIIIAGFTITFIKSLGHIIQLELDMMDLAWTYSTFFAVLMFHYLQITYLADATIQNIMEWLIDIGIWTHLIIPTIGFFLTLTIGSYMQRRVKGIDYG